MTYSVFYRERVAQAFDFAGITTEWVPRSSRPLRRAGHGNACACGLIPSLRNKSYSTGIIAPSVEKLHIEMVKRGPPAPILAFFARTCPEPAEGGTMPPTPRAVRPDALDRTDHCDLHALIVFHNPPHKYLYSM